MRTTEIIVSALSDVLLSDFIDQYDSHYRMIELSGAHFASAQTSSLFAVLSTLFGKRHNGREATAHYVNEF